LTFRLKIKKNRREKIRTQCTKINKCATRIQYVTFGKTWIIKDLSYGFCKMYIAQDHGRYLVFIVKISRTAFSKKKLFYISRFLLYEFFTTGIYRNEFNFNIATWTIMNRILCHILNWNVPREMTLILMYTFWFINKTTQYMSW